MGDPSLMHIAQEIEDNAINREYEDSLRAVNSGPEGTGSISREPIEQKYRGTIPPLFEPFTRMPDPDSYNAPIQALDDALQQMSSGQQPKDPINNRRLRANSDLAHAESAGTNLENWTGHAADNFKRNFLDKFPYIVKNQFLLIGIMKGALEADQERWKKAARDIRDLAYRTKDGLNNHSMSGINVFTYVFSVVSAIVAIGAIPATGGGSAAVLPAVGAAGSTANMAVTGANLVVTNQGGTVDRVIQSMKEGIDRLTKEIQNSGGQIAGTLNGVQEQLQTAKKDFVSPPPAFAGMQPDKTTGEEGLGRAD